MRISDWSSDVCSSDLDRVDPDAAAIARERYGCLAPWGSDPAAYGRMALTEGFARCEEAVVKQLRELFTHSRDYAAQDGEEFLDATQNARLVANAEAYYRVMYHGAAESWNLRDTHMFETLELLLRAKGPQSKAQRSEEQTSALQSLMRISYAVVCLKTKKIATTETTITETD